MTSRQLISVQYLLLFYFKTSEVESTDLFVFYTAGWPTVNTCSRRCQAAVRRSRACRDCEEANRDVLVHQLSHARARTHTGLARDKYPSCLHIAIVFLSSVP